MTTGSSRILHFSAIFFVANRKEVLDYYSRLGFSCDYGMGFVERAGLNLIVHETTQADAITPNNPIHRADALDVFAMVEGVEDLFEEFKAKDAQFLYEIRTNSYQMREFAIMDPAGYTIGFGESLI